MVDCVSIQPKFAMVKLIAQRVTMRNSRHAVSGPRVQFDSIVLNRLSLS
jgi:hypothetical protein